MFYPGISNACVSDDKMLQRFTKLQKEIFDKQQKKEKKLRQEGLRNFIEEMKSTKEEHGMTWSEVVEIYKAFENDMRRYGSLIGSPILASQMGIGEITEDTLKVLEELSKTQDAEDPHIIQAQEQEEIPLG